MYDNRVSSFGDYLKKSDKKEDKKMRQKKVTKGALKNKPKKTELKDNRKG